MRMRFSRGFLIEAFYTRGTALTYGGSEEGINDLQDPNCTRCSRSRTTLSLAHIGSINYGWDLPFQRVGWLPKVVTSGWRVNGITSLRSGFPLNITSGRDNFGSGQPLGQRPNYVGGQDIRAGTDGFADANRHLFVNTAAFTPNAKGQYGNLGGYVLNGPGNATFDFSVFKSFRMRERAALQFRSEFFNLFNRVNFSNPNTAQNSGNVGVITAAAASREIQFGLKLLF